MTEYLDPILIESTDALRASLRTNFHDVLGENKAVVETRYGRVLTSTLRHAGYDGPRRVNGFISVEGRDTQSKRMGDVVVDRITGADIQSEITEIVCKQFNLGSDDVRFDRPDKRFDNYTFAEFPRSEMVIPRPTNQHNQRPHIFDVKKPQDGRFVDRDWVPDGPHRYSTV